MGDSLPILLSNDDVQNCLQDKWDDLILVIEKALKCFSTGGVVQPVRAAVPVEQNNGLLLAMPGYSTEDDALATKIVTIFPDNNSMGLPAVQSVVLLYDASTGSLKAIMNGHVITNMRTAAASAVATMRLANEDSRVLAILGAGVQARSHYQALTHMFEFPKIKVWNINEKSGQKFAEEIRRDGYNVEYHSEVKDAVQDADIIVTATMSKTPILKKSWVKPGAHINAVGACDPTWQELSEDLVATSTLYVDSKEAALVESGDIIKSKATVYAEIGEVIAGTKKAHREKTTIFKSLGMAVEDVVTAKLVLELHQK